MTLLDDIIDASTDSAVATPDLLRKVQIVAHRLGAVDLVSWAKQELYGYSAEVELPTYRLLNTNVVGTFAGPMRSFIPHQLTVKPDGMSDEWIVPLREPLITIQGWADGDEVSREWSAHHVSEYERSGVFRLQFHSLYSARNVVDRESLRGMVDTVRTKALEFALELQGRFPDAGSVGGPTVADEPALAMSVYNITNYINGHGTNVASGANIQQRSRVQQGDLPAFKHEIEDIGLALEDVNEFVAAVQEERSVDSPRVRGFLERVRSGAVHLGGSVSSDVAAGVLIELGKGFLGLS